MMQQDGSPMPTWERYMDKIAEQLSVDLGKVESKLDDIFKILDDRRKENEERRTKNGGNKLSIVKLPITDSENWRMRKPPTELSGRECLWL